MYVASEGTMCEVRVAVDVDAGEEQFGAWPPQEVRANGWVGWWWTMLAIWL